MESLLNSTDILERTGLTLIHSLWQAGAIALVLLLFLKIIPSRKTVLRYNLGFAALVGFLTSILMTWSWLGMEPELPADPDRKSNTVFATAQDASSGGLSEGSSNRPLPTARETSLPTSSLLSENLVILKPWAVWITPFWAIGAILMLIHTFRTTLVVSRIRNEAVSLCDRTLDLINDEFRQALRIARPVTIQLSQEILSPAVMGILKPVILFPASMLNHLPTEQMKAILAHELAHIRRNDYLVNLVQRVIESLFYFNPCVWLINRQIRSEREACCDAVAI